MTKFSTTYDRASRLIFGINYDKLSTEAEKDYVESVLNGRTGHEFGKREKLYIKNGGRVPKSAVFYWMKRRKLNKVV
jgi:hypothetical protein